MSRNKGNFFPLKWGRREIKEKNKKEELEREYLDKLRLAKEEYKKQYNSFFIKQKKLPPPDFMKIDTQGSEIDILKGCGKYLKKVKLLYLECPVININQGARDISEYLTFTKKAGFIPLDICEKHIHNNILLQIDILFVNKYFGS